MRFKTQFKKYQLFCRRGSCLAIIVFLEKTIKSFEVII